VHPVPAGCVIRPLAGAHLYARDKSRHGHDENISFERAASLIGKELAEKVRAVSWKSTAALPPMPSRAGDPRRHKVRVRHLYRRARTCGGR